MKILRIFLVVFVFSNSYAKTYHLPIDKVNISDSIVLKANRLRSLYILIKKSPSSNVYKKQFFDAFPNTYKQFNDIYGYNSKTNVSAPLEGVYYEHISGVFNNLNNINDTLYYKKIISITIGGHWDADAVNAFHDGLVKRIESKPELTVSILKTMPDSKIKSFWFFYFDGAHPKKQLPKQIQKIEQINKRIYTLLIEAQTQVLKQVH